ncbi:MAG: hypothetical protein ACR2RA_22745 [Geminicoccaceae bacterium]
MPKYKLAFVDMKLDAVHCIHHKNDPIVMFSANENEARFAIHSVVRKFTGGGDTSPWLDKSKTVCQQVEMDGLELRT